MNDGEHTCGSASLKVGKGRLGATLDDNREVVCSFLHISKTTILIKKHGAEKFRVSSQPRCVNLEPFAFDL